MPVIYIVPKVPAPGATAPSSNYPNVQESNDASRTKPQHAENQKVTRILKNWDWERSNGKTEPLSSLDRKGKIATLTANRVTAAKGALTENLILDAGEGKHLTIEEA